LGRPTIRSDGVLLSPAEIAKRYRDNKRKRGGDLTQKEIDALVRKRELLEAGIIDRIKANAVGDGEVWGKIVYIQFLRVTLGTFHLRASKILKHGKPFLTGLVEMRTVLELAVASPGADVFPAVKEANVRIIQAIETAENAVGSVFSRLEDHGLKKYDWKDLVAFILSVTWGARTDESGSTAPLGVGSPACLFICEFLKFVGIAKDPVTVSRALREANAEANLPGLDEN
jgi:hypothetical protein